MRVQQIRWRWMGGMVMALGLIGLSVHAQTALRVKGTTSAAGGAGVAATVELDALYGYRGLQFVGQKSFKARASDKGQWSVLGVTSGIWVFAAHAPGRLPQVLLLPVQFTQKNPSSAAGGQIPWDVSFELVTVEPGSDLERAARAAVAADRPGVEAALSAVAETGDAAALVAAGEIALMVRATALAGALFERAVVKEPTLGRAHLGLASAAMMNGAWDAAAKRLWSARENGLPERLKRAVGAAITELQRITRTDADAR